MPFEASGKKDSFKELRVTFVIFPIRSLLDFFKSSIFVSEGKANSWCGGVSCMIHSAARTYKKFTQALSQGKPRRMRAPSTSGGRRSLKSFHEITSSESNTVK